MGASKQKTTSSQTSNPWGPSEPLLRDQVGGIRDWLSSGDGSQVYGGPRVADWNSNLQRGVDTLGRGTGAQASSRYLQDVLGGKYLNNNPHQAAMDASIRSAVMPSLNAQFSNAGMSGSTMHQGMLGKALTEGMAAPRYQQYQNERGAMGQAAGLLPQVETQMGQNQLYAGGLQQQHRQNQINAEMGRFNEQRDSGIRPYLMTGDLSRGLGSVGGTTSGTQTSSTQPSLGQQILGGGMMLGSLASGMPFAGFGAGMSGMSGLLGSGAIGGIANGMAGATGGISNPYGTPMPSAWGGLGGPWR